MVHDSPPPDSPRVWESPDTPPWFAQLNDAQRAAVQYTDGPLLVLAGAGTGKTRVLTARLAYLIASNKARSWDILAVTFTNKAAREMRERVAKLIGHDVEGWWIGTFHALAARILRAHAGIVGLQSNFSIIDTDDQIRLLKQLMSARNIDEKRWPARALANIIQRWKDRGLTTEQINLDDVEELAGGQARELYEDYQERLKTLNACDFGDLLLHCLSLFKQEADILERYRRKFRYILVDEYQDTNVAQYLWLRLLIGEEGNICCVGDDDQSIYSWRGAEVGNILRFEQDFPKAKIVRLELNYRSTPEILASASGIISQNQGRLGKTLWTHAESGEPVRVRGVYDGEGEARMVADEIESLHRQKEALNSMAILVRAGFQTREFEDRLITLSIPYRIIGGLRFYERQEIRDAVAYLRVIGQPNDDLALERIINVPKRGIGQSTLQTLNAYARKKEISLYNAIMMLLETDEVAAKARASLRTLMQNFDRWRQALERVSHPEVAAEMLDESGYTGMWQEKAAGEQNPDARGRLDNLKELITALEDFPTLGGFLEHVSLVMENETDDQQDKVTLMTLHGAKGLEFDTVFLPGWEEGLFPHQRALDEGGENALEEERRLAYVGITRAKKRALISYAANRRVHYQWQNSLPSRFISELPQNHIEVRSESGLYQGKPTRNQHQWQHQWTSRTRRNPLMASSPHSSNAPPSNIPPGGWQAGMRVFHQKFGYGHITHIEGIKLDIAFDKAGNKRVMESFIEKV